ncbi:SDR family oxidoreductase [Candidatus Poribacteria bacterium]|nr:SDR family oxidoreductase [Candidatus Poribacteria bacterium]MBT5535765.1 SDR family oxidoreductase [Candidatus Poribacteria bacterium]MBT5714555.1 SDR family oxidoreductase [Candidatus Poribacteria bacterium]MBT7100514.1 SDR family oxidoreductase [Candidatus Poribacteria bacterium]MBT7806928.1 SDR family oxidoreductase [Candidatus Poribacteria bacterium]
MGVLDRFRLDGRVALVTGGSKGLGEAMALGLAEAGAKVVVTSRHADECEETAQRIIDATGGDILALEGDVTDKAQVEANVADTLAHFGQIDILVNNAGTNVRTGTIDLPLEDWQRIVDVNLTGPFICAQACLPHMVERRYGRIINLSSIFGAVGFPSRSPYTATKGGLLNITRAWALEFANDGITVNAICPGPFDTPMNRPLRDDPVAYQTFVSKIPMGRWGDLEELSSVAVFLASEASSYVTGSALFVDGGWTAQ